MKTFDMDLKFGYLLAQKRQVEKESKEEKKNQYYESI